MDMNINKMWSLWIVITIISTAVLSYKLFFDDDKTVFLPGTTSHGHYQIEMACVACHKDSFTSKEGLQEACVSCHGQELKAVEDSHPKSKFTDPRNADRVAKLDARYCVTCHGEHKPEITGLMGVTVQEDICIVCHQDIADDRPSHKRMSFLTCTSSGCHNFHDNKALYEDFLLKHADEENTFKQPANKIRNFTARINALHSYPLKEYPLIELQVQDKDMPSSIEPDQKIVEEWAGTAHAKSGVNCTACHNVVNKDGSVNWKDKPSEKSCKTCHESEVTEFLDSKHGMRIKQNLTPMIPVKARIKMKSSAHKSELSCVSCHSSHKFDTRRASIDACLKCHDDKHSLAYKDSKHFSLSYAEITKGEETNTSVTCATCHLPRFEKQFSDGSKHVVVQHNQNDNLRPNEKMIRSVCMNCHGLEFSIDSLTDKELIDKNFTGQPSVHIKSIDMAKQRVKNKR